MAPDYKIQEVKTPRATVLLACFCVKKSLPSWLMEAPLLVLFVLVLLPLALKSLGVFGLSQENIIILAMVLQQVGFLLGTFILKKRHPVHPTDILDTRFEWKAFGGVFCGFLRLFLSMYWESFFLRNCSLRCSELTGCSRFCSRKLQESTSSFLALGGW